MPYRRRAQETGQKLCFDIGRHLLRLDRCPDGWAASVDGLSLAGRYPSQAQAWQEGVRAALVLEGQVSWPAAQASTEQATPGGAHLPTDALATGED